MALPRTNRPSTVVTSWCDWTSATSLRQICGISKHLRYSNAARTDLCHFTRAALILPYFNSAVTDLRRPRPDLWLSAVFRQVEKLSYRYSAATARRKARNTTSKVCNTWNNPKGHSAMALFDISFPISNLHRSSTCSVRKLVPWGWVQSF